MESVGIAALLWVCSSELRAWLLAAWPWVSRRVTGGQKWH